MTDDRDRWNERYRDDEFELPDDPVPELARRIDTLPDGRALDVATGSGRNALFLAEHGYDVEAVDVSDEALAQARARADELDLEIDWIRADVTDPEGAFQLEPRAYDLIVVSFFYSPELLPELKEALAPGGVLVYEHHLRSSDPVEVGPSDDRVRFRSNDLLRSCLDLTVLHYAEATRHGKEDGRPSTIATVVARKSCGGAQSYPAERDMRDAPRE
ncbi:class I SAM-dependent methyltransferase [Halalkaliarchaeum sp. AArc-GB]|uniref:class I SAM-dependent methyltransferase n=1 Tax=Halalkaliarchaeum sp. AArc-GB TaxID=3074078 RepID=UPI00285FB760|nr:class I SAM-dependent methyltransferase [Halalkaliarchaeum sp. AArc-GB]MDR5672707.1 class I SAM-dependent methyltransferase [Halalkaliarchaeum sp. AArc-GB]